MKQKNYTSLMLLLCLWVLGVGNVKGQTEQFNFSGALNANGWTSHSASTTFGQLTTSTGSLSYAGMPASVGNRVTTVAGNAEDVNKATSTPFTGFVCASLLINVTNTTGLTTTGDYFFSFGQTNGASVTVLPGRIYIRGTSATTFQLGTVNQSGTGSTPSYITTGPKGTLNTGTTYLVVVRYNISTNTSSLWVDPVINGTEPTADLINNTGANTATEVRSICIRQGGTATVGTGNVEIDEIRVGANFTDVVPFVAATPTITLGSTSLTGFTTTVGTPSTTQQYGVSGANLTGDITITAPAGFEIKRSVDPTYSSTVTLTPSSGTVSLTAIDVRLTGASVGTPSGNITHTSTGATQQDVAVSGTVNAPPATLTVNPTSLSGFTTVTGTASAEQSYTLSGANLTGFPANIAVTAPTGYEVSLTSGSGFAGSVNVPYTSATLSNTSIFVGTVNPLTPTLNVNPTSLSGFTTITGTASTEQSYTLSGTNLTGFPANITVTAPTGYEVSLTSGSGFAGSVNVPYTSATLSNTSIFVRIAASAGVGTPSGNITNVGGGATTQNVAVSGTVNPVPTPILTVNPTSLSGFTTTAGTASANQSYTLSGTDLTGFPANIAVTAPTGYEVSLTSGSGFAGSVNVPYTSATLSNTSIFVC
ncbi:MAG: hypothetical protein MUC49_18705 [Raineya sp.]|nr:hypothetical protein [Raineya sp.]